MVPEIRINLNPSFRALMVILYLSLPSHDAVPNSSSKAIKLSNASPTDQADHDCDLKSDRLFVVASEYNSSKVGWLICTGPASWIYSPPAILKMEGQASAFGLKLQSGDTLRGRYDVQASIRGRDLSGRLVINSDSSPAGTKEFIIHGSQLDTDRDSGFPQGRYSNVKYIPESGDLVGAELLIFRAANQMSGLLTFYESYWNEPAFTCFVLENIQLSSAKTIKFELKVSNEIFEYALDQQRDSVILHRIDGSPPSSHGVKLLKQPRLVP